MLTVALVAVAYAGGLMALYSTLRLFAGAVWAACITICAGGATILLPDATVFNNHVVSGALVALALRLLVDRRPGVRGVAIAGAALALAAAIDLSFAIFLVLAPLLLVRHGLWRTIAPFAAAAAPIVAAYFALTCCCRETSCRPRSICRSGIIRALSSIGRTSPVSPGNGRSRTTRAMPSTC